MTNLGYRETHRRMKKFTGVTGKCTWVDSNYTRGTEKCTVRREDGEMHKGDKDKHIYDGATQKRMEKPGWDFSRQGGNNLGKKL